eukprot:TRINITY_DN1082_c4_g1_i1.p1 TRINITY_DN1082_c4_g1~~TRINITY_DN1082_c4_g1_i1.p1  ORF type:complete len:242 (-),score=45.68 TRINITY_DN1082_c4_g1_i1:172-795(-)
MPRPDLQLNSLGTLMRDQHSIDADRAFDELQHSAVQGDVEAFRACLVRGVGIENLDPAVRQGLFGDVEEGINSCLTCGFISERSECFVLNVCLQCVDEAARACHITTRPSVPRSLRRRTESTPVFQSIGNGLVECRCALNNCLITVDVQRCLTHLRPLLRHPITSFFSVNSSRMSSSSPSPSHLSPFAPRMSRSGDLLTQRSILSVR